MPWQVPAFDSLLVSFYVYFGSYSMAHCLTLQSVADIICPEVQIDRYVTSLFISFFYLFIFP